MGSRNRCRDGGRSNLIVNYNNDYLAERSGRRRAVPDHERGRVLCTGRRSSQTAEKSTVCKASRSVAGGVDSQARGKGNLWMPWHAQDMKAVARSGKLQ